MSFPFLLLLYLFPLIFARPIPLSIHQSSCTSESRTPNCASTPVILLNGKASERVNTFFNLSSTDLSKATQPVPTILQGEDIISNVSFANPSAPSPDHDNVVYPVIVTFNNLPGEAQLRISITDSTGKLHIFTLNFQVIGLVLYEDNANERRILTGLNPLRTYVQPADDGSLATTVKVRAFPGSVTTPLRKTDIRLRVASNSDVLPWTTDNCPIAAPTVLDDNCAMAFSDTFDNFSIRIPPGRDFSSEIRVEFEWVGIRDYQNSLTGEFGVTGTDDPISLTDDFITSILVDRQRALGDERSNPSTPLAGWKIGVIAITSVLLVIAAITLVCCYFCGRKRSPKKPEPDVVGFRDKFQEIGFLRRVSTLRRGDGDDDDQCYVEEPPTPDDSEILMLENESRGHRRSAEEHIEGLIPMDRLNEDKSVERLVLPPGVVRGVELESSTEGASGFGYDSRSRENDAGSYGRGMASAPRDHFAKQRDYHRTSRDRSSAASRRSDVERSREAEYLRDPDYLRDSHERIRSLERDRARIREIDREIARERSEERMRPRSSAEEFPDSGPAFDDRSNGVSRSRGGVGAAINRIRQLDLLNGPASRGLVGRNGEPIQKPDGEDAASADVEISANSIS